jgi:glutaminyl-peptide cyclotransferase
MTLVMLGLVSCGAGTRDAPVGESSVRPAGEAPTALRAEVLGEIPWPADTFTQGLEFDGPDRLLASSGRYGISNLQEIDPATGLARRVMPLDPQFFAEGITLVNNGGTDLVMLTWREGVVIWFDPDSLIERRRGPLDGEGWGICQLDNGQVVTSDGTSRLTLRDPATLSALGSVEVRRAGVPVERLNELECDGATVWANVWQTDRIERIDMASGDVIASVDASGLLDRTTAPGADVLNGIARIPGTNDEFLVTGKLWPTAFRVRFVAA